MTRFSLSGLLGLALCVNPGALGQQVIYVNGSTGDDAWDGYCPTWDGGACGPKRTIQAGIAAAVDGDAVRVADGTYSGAGNRDLDFGGRAITLRSQSGDPKTCIIDCGGVPKDPHRGFYFHSGETPESVVEGFTIRSGFAPGAATVADGGAVYCTDSSPSIRRCIIEWNAALHHGGGIYCTNGSAAKISDCVIGLNTAAYYGGGVHVSGDSSPTLTNCTIVGNSAYYGAGFYCLGGSPLLKQSTLTQNIAPHGGAIGCFESTGLVVTNCAIVGNIAYNGGGSTVRNTSDATFISCLITGNLGYDGGGLYCNGSSSFTLDNCTIAGNEAHFGGGLVAYDFRTRTISSSILWGNAAKFGPQLALRKTFGAAAPDKLTVSYSDVQGGAAAVYLEEGVPLGWGKGNLDADPLFTGGTSGAWTADAVVDPASYLVTFFDLTAHWADNELVGKFVVANVGEPLQYVIVANTATTITAWSDRQSVDQEKSWVAVNMPYQIVDYHVLAGSPVIGAGNPQTFGLGASDLDGEPRVMGGRVDMGADESPARAFVFGDLNCDGVRSAADIDPFVLALTDPAGYAAAYPECDRANADINGDEKVDAFDVAPFVELLTGG